MEQPLVPIGDLAVAMPSAKAPKPIYLYCAIGERDQFRPIPRSRMKQFQVRLGRLVDDIMWRGLGRWRFEYWRYEDRQATNVGDIAIREACVELVRRAIPGAPAIRTLTWNRLDAAMVDEINREAAAFVVAGGGYFIFDERWRLNRRLDLDLPGFSALRVPRIMLGVGVNNPAIREVPAEDAVFDLQTAARLREVLALFDLVTVRDAFSQRMLRPFVPREVFTVPDPALFLASLRPGDTVATEAAGNPPRVGLNLALHGRYSEALLGRNFATYVEAFRTYQRESGCDYVYFAHSDAERKIPELLARAGLRLRKAEGGPGKLIEQYRGLSFHVCQMLHSSILAMSTDCPTVGIAYDVKSHGFFEMMGVAGDCLSADEVTSDAILQAMRRVATNPDERRRELAARRQSLFGVMTSVLGRMAAVIESRTA